MPHKFNKSIRIGDFLISEASPAFIIAEAGVNHNGKMDLAIKMIDVAAECGASAVKFQAFRTEELILKSVEKAPYQKETTGAEEGQFEMLKKLEVRAEQFAELKEYSRKKGIGFLVTPFDEASLDELDALKLDAYKIASTDLTNLPFLKRIAKKGKPMILSTGMSYLSEVELALEEIAAINTDLIVLHCTGNYPTAPREVNLNVLQVFREKLGVLTGYSDHTENVGASPYAVAVGAKVIEKHFTLDKKLEGPDQKASLDPRELKAFIEEIRKVEAYLGTSLKAPQPSELKTRMSLQKNLVARRAIKKGERFTEENVVAKRTGGNGISPIAYRKVCSSEAPADFNKDDLIFLS
jgi:N-acetylneuraminate synthase